MGKYIRKDKTTCEFAVMEVSQSPLGVRTRAKTLALQRLQKSLAPTPSPDSSGSYLQLRSRRLAKPPTILPGNESKRQKQAQRDDYRRNPRARLRVGSVASESDGSLALARVSEEDDQLARKKNKMECKADVDIPEKKIENNENVDFGAQEVSFGENILDFENRERTTRESTPCSLIRDPGAMHTPGSTTRPISSTTESNGRLLQNSSRRQIPTSREMEEFFNGPEEEKQKEFIKKYNFDPAEDKPLPGRYEWEKLDP